MTAEQEISLLKDRVTFLEGILVRKGSRMAKAQAGAQGETIARDALSLAAGFFNKKISVLTGPSRRRGDVWPRWIAIHLAYKHSGLGHVRLGQIFNRDHGSICNALEGVRDSIGIDDHRRQQVQILETEFQSILQPKSETAKL